MHMLARKLRTRLVAGPNLRMIVSGRRECLRVANGPRAIKVMFFGCSQSPFLHQRGKSSPIVWLLACSLIWMHRNIVQLFGCTDDSFIVFSQFKLVRIPCHSHSIACYIRSHHSKAQDPHDHDDQEDNDEIFDPSLAYIRCSFQ
jgi:hypothetical protein